MEDQHKPELTNRRKELTHFKKEREVKKKQKLRLNWM